MFGRLAVAAACLCGVASAASWNLTRNEHFEIWSQVDRGHARELLNWLERLRAFFLSQSIIKQDAIPVRVILFASPREYEPFRVRASADAHFVGSESGRYIAMVAGPDERRIAAHELAHVVLASGGTSYPAWLNEGLAEFFSTVRIDDAGSQVGAEIAVHVQTLRRRPWLSLSELLEVPSDSPSRADRENEELFYAQSWALVDMLLLSPEYAPRFQNMVTFVRAGSRGADALASFYGKPTEAMEHDLREWIGKRSARTLYLPGASAAIASASASDVTDFAARSVLADMLATAGELGRAESLLHDLAREAPEDARISATLGAVALRQGDPDTARRQWKQAMERGLKDAEICYRYAVLADDAGLPKDEIRWALQQALVLQPDFDDARYRLALIEKNGGHYDAAVAQLRAMRGVAPAREFSYWSVLADALNELGRREEAVIAARKAEQHAGTAQERAWASRMAYYAQTDMAVQVIRDANGREHMVTTRVPHQSAEDWNPFVEAGDDVRTVHGVLREIECSDTGTRIRVDASGALLTLAIADPSRVRMRNAPDEFVCGPQENVSVDVQYAASGSGGVNGLVRGIDFH